MAKANILLTGATGYIGGAIFVKLLEKKSEFTISAVVRDKEKAAKIEELGARAVIADINDLEVLKKEASNNDIVIHTADASDHLPSAKAFIEGLNERAAKSTKKPIYIHTSGTGVLTDDAFGEYVSEKVHNDDVFADTHENIPDSAWHRDVDLTVYAAGKTGLLDIYIVCPPLIYGTSKGPFRRDSQQIPGLIQCSLKYGKAVFVGKGQNVWNNVHIDDLADFYFLLTEKALNGEAPKNDEGYYFVENGSHNWKELAEKIGAALHKYGIAKDAAPYGIEINDGSIIPKILVKATGGNSRSKAVKARKLGWNPKREPVFDTLDETVKRIANIQ